MEDKEILELFNARNQQAISKTADKYGNYCYSISFNILANAEDSEECVNDTYMKAWQSIPPDYPHIFSAYLGKITRNLSLDKYRHKYAKKRGNATVNVVFEELENCISETKSIVDEIELTELINNFLKTLSDDKCRIFVRRYWYADSVTELAAMTNGSANRISVRLFRLREKLRITLMKEGFLA